MSYFFYGWWDWRFLSLIILSSVVDFVVGNMLFEEENPQRKRALVTISLMVNLGCLAFFKYANFFVGSFSDAFTLFGFQPNFSTLNIILPVGISFYTFQTLSYTLDIYAGKLEPTKNLTAFLAFVSFFPQLVAGPIERARNLLPQFYKTSGITYDMLRSGLLLMAWGLFKKVVIADRLAVYVDSVYQNPGEAAGISSLVAVIFFAFQLYLDFSAYSDIAIGCARTLGIRLSKNFNHPYFASSFSDFWKRWHISLSTWFRDYVYIPLGGNKRGIWNARRNIFIVFMLSGLWHGASWNFVLWGAINGFFLILFDRIFLRFPKNTFGRIFTSLFVSLSWAFSLIFFRAETFSDAIALFGNLGLSNAKNLFSFGLSPSEFRFTLLSLSFLIVTEIIFEKTDQAYVFFVKRNFVVRWSSYILLLISIVIFGAYGEGFNDSNFIYFQF